LDRIKSQVKKGLSGANQQQRTYSHKAAKVSGTRWSGK